MTSIASFLRSKSQASLARTLVRKVFSVYFLVALAVTALQVAMNYRQAYAQVVDELDAEAHAFEPGVTEAVWNYQASLAESIARGAVDGRVVLGVLIRDKAGHVNIKLTFPGVLSGGLGVSHRTELFHVHSDGRREVIGEMMLYSNHDVVIARVRFGLMLEFLSSLVKTCSLWFVIVYFANRLLARPLRQLTGQIARFDVAHSLEPPRVVLGRADSGELVYLGEAFNDLARRMVDHRRELAELAETLEQRVTERTAEVAHERDFSLALVQSIPELFFLVTRGGTLSMFNPNVRRNVVLPDDPTARVDLASLVAAHDADVVIATIDKAFAEGEAACEAEFHFRDSREVPHYMIVRRVQLDDGVHAIVVAVDITARRQAEEQMRHLALYDALTDLPNRAMLHDRLAQVTAMALRRDQCMAVLYMDLDGFKAINDNAGHEVGDEVLREVSRRLLKGVRTTDTVARYGGDEFVLLLTVIANSQAAARIAEQLIEAVSEPIVVGSGVYRVGASVGISVMPDHATSGAALLETADAAMYRAKRRGKGCYEFARIEAKDAAG